MSSITSASTKPASSLGILEASAPRSDFFGRERVFDDGGWLLLLEEVTLKFPESETVHYLTNELERDVSGRVSGEEFELLVPESGGSGHVVDQSWTREYDYDSAGQLTEIIDAETETTLASIQYDTHGRRSTHATPAGTTNYSWDEIGQLTQVDHPNATSSAFTYDEAGRRDSRTRGDTHEMYEYDPSGKLEQRIITYDEAAAWTETRSWDPNGGLASVEHTDHAKDATTTDTLFWDPTSPVAQLRLWTHDSDASTTEFSLWQDLAGEPRGDGHNGPYAIDVYGSHYDLWSDEPGHSLAGTTGYNPWGLPIDHAEQHAYMGYRGELHIGGLIHLRNRDYDPLTGTFTTPDPLDGVDGTTTVANPYHYADNDPLNKVDPLGLRPTEGPCSEFSHTGAVIDSATCDTALELWEKRDRSLPDCAAVGGVNYGSGTCFSPPQSRQEKALCFPPALADDVISYGPDGTCGVWRVEIKCARLSSAITDPICRRRVGILKVAGYALIPAAIAVTVGTGGLAAAPSAGAILAVTSGSLHISAEALDDKPCRSQRITVTAVLTILGGGVGGAFSSGGMVIGEAATQAGLAGLEAVEFSC